VIECKRYIVFVGEVYYPSGWNDFVLATDDLEEAKAVAAKGIRHRRDYRWSSIIDLSTMTEMPLP
jgi:hypothetical protein